MIFSHTSAREPHWPVLSQEEAERWDGVGRYLREKLSGGEPITILYAASQSGNESVAHVIGTPTPQGWKLKQCPGLGADDEQGSLHGAVSCLMSAWESTATVVVVTNESLAAELTQFVAEFFRHELHVPVTPHTGGWILQERRWARLAG